MVSYITTKKVEKYIRNWLSSNRIKNVSLGKVLFQAGFQPTETVILSSDKNGRENFIQYKIDGKEGEIEFINYPRPQIIIHGDKNFPSYTECYLDIEPKCHKYSLKQSEKLIHNVYDDGCQLRERVRYNKIFFSIRFEYDGTPTLNKRISFSLKNYGYNEYSFNKEKNLQLEKYLRELTLPISIIEVYNKICKFFSIGTNNQCVYLSVTDNDKGNFSSNFDINDMCNMDGRVISITENNVNLRFERIGNISKINVSKGVSSCSIKYKTTNKDLEGILNYSVEENLIKHLMKIKYPTSAVDIYKKLCELSILEIEEFSEFTLSCCNDSTNTNSNNSETIIIIENGQFISPTEYNSGKSEVEHTNLGQGISPSNNSPQSESLRLVRKKQPNQSGKK